MKVKWFFQHPGYQLGDFVMMTPGLRAISEMDGIPLPVYFSTPYIADLYRNCKFMKVLSNKPKNKAFMGTQFSSYNPNHYYKTRKNKKESMAECFFRRFASEKGYNKPMPNTYVDRNISLKLKRKEGHKYIAMFHGCLGKEFIPKKSIPIKMLKDILNAIVDEGYRVILLGSALDRTRFWKNIDTTHSCIQDYVGKLNIKDSVSLLSQCDAFVSNDSGLYHVAGALEKKGLVFWGTTDIYKNRANFLGIKIQKMSETESYSKFAIEFLESLFSQ